MALGFKVGWIIYAKIITCNDETYDFSYNIDFSGQKKKKKKNKDLAIKNLLNFLIDGKNQKAIADFNSQQNKSYKSTSDKSLIYLKISVGVVLFLVLGLTALSLWLVSLISVTCCFIELGLFVFHQIINFIVRHLSEENCIGKIIEHKYTQRFLIFMQFPIVLTLIVGFISLFSLLCCVGGCACCCINSCCPSVLPDFLDENENNPNENENNDEGRRAAIRALIDLGQALNNQNSPDSNRYNQNDQI